MIILLVSDLHGDIDRLSKLKEEAEAADLLIVAGDLTHFGGRSDALRVIEGCRNLGLPLFLIHGNCDTEEAARCIAEQEGSLHLVSRDFSGIRFVGLGGSLPGPLETPSTMDEEALNRELSSISLPQDGMPLIFVSHQPPHGSCADRAMKMKHVGSTSVARWSEAVAPIAHLCGHIHESACVGRIGRTVLVNPGAFKDGRYAVVRIAGGVAEAELRRV
ncbi:metallophosphoesterase family protein [Sediminispirochaeta smaragdinae]|uniref:Metallophosphoesterase n=1 Tax=Sediminispirochaeta smaragdinae (strain DSM 11293 / JCM 15392 / SEBR 4228) TaxID=573413 RepID=E1R5B9_SEDSS|nr:metallophosphoesterase family protein [Sediminispirochaeta smaragdinae]ADK82247.1 metallophosphoesterase [Sediminispirochaeta smaragdinae DSM 11293]